MEKCIPCLAVGKSQPPEQMNVKNIPKGPWETIHADFYSPLPSREYLLVVNDRYCRYPEVEIVPSTKAAAVIPKLDKIFHQHNL